MFFQNGYAQVPSPGKAQTETIILRGGFAHIGNGTVIENSVVGFENGKITMVGDARTVKLDPLAAKIIDVSGKHLYPGIIAPNTTLGLQEIGAVRATRDHDEVGSMIPNVRTLIAYSTNSRVTPTVRSNGILVAQIAPQGGRISGSSSIVQLDAWNWEDASILENDGIFVNWPSMITVKGWWAEPGGVEENKEYIKQLKELKDFFLEASAYLDKPASEKKNLKFEAMRGVIKERKNVYVRVGFVRGMMAAINFGEEMGVKIVIVGGRDSWKIADLLAEKEIPIILMRTHRLPANDDEDIDQPFKTPKMLHDAGVNYCIGMGGFWDQRNLIFHAGSAAAHGLTKEQALAAITSNTAKILGIDDQFGTLESGKDATIVVSEGDILDMKSSKIENAYISGRKVDLNDKQKMLYEKFRKKYFE